MSTHVLKPPKLRRYHILESISSKTFIPREYQVELLDTARKKNTIVCLGTGTGKTFVAVMLIKELSHQIRKPPSEGGRRTVFLAPTVPLVRQQAKVVTDCTDLIIGLYFGTELVNWSKEDWLKEIENHQVLLMTPDVLKEILHHGIMPLSMLNLIIFDECHNAVGNHPYCEIIKCFDVCLPENRPQILGLSASLINNKCQPSRIEKEIQCLERNLHASVETASEITSLSKYGSKPKEHLVEYFTFIENEPSLNSILSNINNALVFLENIYISYDCSDFLSHPCRQPRRYLIELAHVFINLGPWCTLTAVQLLMDEINFVMQSMFSKTHIQFLVLCRTVLLTVEKQCQNILSGQDLLECLVKYAPPKLKELLKILEAYKPPPLPPVESNGDATLPKNSDIQVPTLNSLENASNNNSSETLVTESKESGDCSIAPTINHAENASNDNLFKSPETKNEQNDKSSIVTTVNSIDDASNNNSSKTSVTDSKQNDNSSIVLDANSVEDASNNNSFETSVNERKQNGISSTVVKTYKNEKRQKHTTLCDDNKSLCGLIFVHQRIIAYLLSEWLSALKEIHPDFTFLSPSYIIGHGKNNSGSKSLLMGFQKQEEVLQKFRTKFYNLVVATSVVEEGMDIPKCNLVIRFDPPENFRAYVQSKGRARVNDSLYLLMVNSKEKEPFINTLCDFKAVEELLLQKCHKTDRDMDDPVLDLNVDNLIEPYMPVKEDGCARVTLSSAIALVNRYCAKLPSDTFTRLTPKWKIVEEDSHSSTPFQCILKLPINSPVKKSIIGPWMKSKQLAKMAAALKTCEELHKAGELDDNLLPTGKEAVKSDDLMEDFEEFKREDEKKGPARAGTTKRRLYYFKKVADALKDSLPVSSSPCYLYVFDMKLTCPIPEEQNTRGRKIHDPSETPRGFGIMTSKPMPPICSFPVFTRSGEVTVTLKCCASNFFLPDDQLEKLAFFHKYTFSDVLRLKKYPMLFRPSDAEASFYVVPITKGNDEEPIIDWQFANLIYKQKTERPGRVSEEERKDFTFNVEDYQDAVVMPWYRNLDKPQFFYVAEICTYLTPQSDFPDLEYETFETYYQKKYSITIMNHSQPLLDVDHTSARLNLLTPRYVNRKGVTLPTSSEQTKRTKRENLQQKQILIPELCTVHPFPAYLWRKAVCLPCILYRLNSLLLAEQLRLLVAESISIGMKYLPQNFKWPALDFGWTLADILVAQNPVSETKEIKQKTVSTYAKKEVVKNGYINPANANSINFIEESFNCNNFEPLESPPLEVNNGVMDFEIDVFDPSKVTIPDDDELLEQELLDINFGMGNPFLNSSKSLPITFGNNVTEPINSCPIWQNAQGSEIIEAQPVSRIRYGSPSNFEGSGWDSEWDIEDEEGGFQAVNFHGLGYISAPGLINMESLSMDLASCRDDMWDSMDEDSVLSDDDMENITFSKSIEASEANDAKLAKNCEELCKDSWLTYPLLVEECSSFVCDTEEESDDALTTTVSCLKESKKKEITYLYPKDKDIIPDSRECDEILKTIVQSEQLLFEELMPECEQDPDNFVSNEKSVSTSSTEEPILAFGELLPNRDHHQLYDNMDRVKFDDCPDLESHPGPSPSIILQALTMSNANDGINLERLETVGDSFLKYAITVYLFCMYPDIHEGKLSYLRSKQISNFNLYKLGKRKGLGELMVASKFEPYDNWLPPNYIVPRGLEEALIESGVPNGCWNLGNLSDLTQMSEDEIRQCIIHKTESTASEVTNYTPQPDLSNPYSLVPYNLLTQHSIPDKSIADCVEALIGAYLVSCGSRGALLFMSWLGLRVLPTVKNEDGKPIKNRFGFLMPPVSPILSTDPKSNLKLEKLLAGYSAFEDKIGYSFNDKSYLLQAFTHASYYYNTLTDCYQRLEFLGDAVLDYLITRHLYEDPKKHSPGTLTDLRSALVNNTFFASLAVKYDFHKFFKAISPGLFNVINKFVLLKEHNSRLEDYLQAYYLEEEECEEMEDVEVPKALGDIFESVAGAIYLDSNMSLDTVWRVYYSMMKPEIEYFSNHVPKSPIRELLELEPQTAKFERAEMTVSGKVRVQVDVFGKGQFVGVGRNKRIAKCTAAKHALRELIKNKNI